VALYCIRCHCQCHRLSDRPAASHLQHRRRSVEASIVLAYSDRRLHFLQSQWSTLPINYGSELRNPILESRALLIQYSRRHGVSAYRIRACYLIGRAILGRDLFSVPCPAAEIAATESDAATVLRKPMWVTKLEYPIRLLLSAPGSRGSRLR
jgi:hypothetical protein